MPVRAGCLAASVLLLLALPGAWAQQPDTAHVAALLAQGAAAEGAADRRAALEDYEAAAVLAPGRADIAVRLGVLLGAAGDFSAATQQFARALQLDPGNPEAHYNLGLAEIGAHTQAPAWAAALQQFDAALQARAQYPEAAREAGVCLLALGRPAEAMTRLRAALAMGEDRAETHLLLGKALEAQGRLAEALAEYTQARALQQPYAEADLRAGSLLLQRGSVAEAAERLRAALTANPDLQEAHYQLAQALRRQGDRAGAAVELRQVAALAQGASDKLMAAHLSNQSLDLAKSGQMAEALQTAEHAVELDPENAVALFNRGLLLASAGRFGEAQRELRKAISQKPLEPRFYGMLARVQAAAGWGAAAQQSWAAARRLDPALPPEAPSAAAGPHAGEEPPDGGFPFGSTADTAAGHTAYAQYLGAQGDDEGMLGELLHAAALAPGNATLRAEVGAARLRLGQKDRAELAYRKAVLMAPDAARPRLGLAQVLADEGSCAAAIAELQRVPGKEGQGPEATALRKQCATRAQ